MGRVTWTFTLLLSATFWLVSCDDDCNDKNLGASAPTTPVQVFNVFDDETDYANAGGSTTMFDFRPDLPADHDPAMGDQFINCRVYQDHCFEGFRRRVPGGGFLGWIYANPGDTITIRLPSASTSVGFTVGPFSSTAGTHVFTLPDGQEIRRDMGNGAPPNYLRFIGITSNLPITHVTYHVENVAGIIWDMRTMSAGTPCSCP